MPIFVSYIYIAQMMRKLVLKCFDTFNFNAIIIFFLNQIAKTLSQPNLPSEKQPGDCIFKHSKERSYSIIQHLSLLSFFKTTFTVRSLKNSFTQRLLKKTWSLILFVIVISLKVKSLADNLKKVHSQIKKTHFQIGEKYIHLQMA